MSIVISHPTGNANVRAVLRAGGAAGLVDSFWTTLAIPPGLAGWSALSPAMQRRLGQRTFPEVAWARTKARPLRETVRQMGRSLGIESLIRHETGWASVDQVYRALDRNVADYLRADRSGRLRAVYAYEDGAYETFHAAADTGVTRVYDLPIAHWRTLRRLLTEEAELHPAWAPTMEGLIDSAGKHDRKDAEIELADRILVASSFTRQSLEEHFGTNSRVTVIPYGAPPATPQPLPERMPDEPLRLFYAGHLSQRKGVAYLIAALNRLDVPWHLTLAGPRPVAAPAELDRFLSDTRCRWLGVVPHATLLEHMRAAHVFVFPSIVEGFGMVLTEALSAGLPIITTPHTAGPDIIMAGREGFIVPIRDADAITKHLTQLYEDEPLRQSMARAAQSKAQALTWAAYERSIALVLAEAVKGRPGA